MFLLINKEVYFSLPHLSIRSLLVYRLLTDKKLLLEGQGGLIEVRPLCVFSIPTPALWYLFASHISSYDIRWFICATRVCLIGDSYAYSQRRKLVSVGG